MSYDEYDAARDAFYEKVREDLTPEIIQEFKSERLTSYFDSNRTVAEKPFRALTEARKLLTDSHETAAFIHAVIASEVTIKTVFIHPLVIGVVHNEVIAPIITDMVLGQTRGQFQKVEGLFLNILNEIANVDLEKYLRSGSKKPLLKEIFEIQSKRNVILHRADDATKDEAQYAISVAAEILEQVFPKVAKELGFHVHDGFKLCRNWLCSQPESVKAILEGRFKK
jgi:hypothetical protein